MAAGIAGRQAASCYLKALVAAGVPEAVIASAAASIAQQERKTAQITAD